MRPVRPDQKVSIVCFPGILSLRRFPGTPLSQAAVKFLSLLHDLPQCPAIAALFEEMGELAPGIEWECVGGGDAREEDVQNLGDVFVLFGNELLFQCGNSLLEIINLLLARGVISFSS